MNRKSNQQMLIEQAVRARSKSRAKYSSFKVGAALQTSRGEIFSGCNIESSSYGLSICAERVALHNALAAGKSGFTCMAVVGPAGDFCPPCGACRQVLHDYAPDLKIILTDGKTIKTVPLKKLLPLAFDDTKLKKK